MRSRPRSSIAAVAVLIAVALVAGGANADDAPSLRRKPAKPSDAAIGAPADSVTTSAVRPGERKAAEERAEVKVLMSYQDAELKRVDVGGGSLVEAVESIAAAIEGAGLGPTRHGVFQVPIAMTYERIAEGLYDVSLEVGAPAISIDARLKPETRAALETEARTLVTRLRTWRRPLSEAEMRRLFGYDEHVAITLAEPFAHVRTWSHTVPVIDLRLKSPPKPRPILRYVALSPDGETEVLYELPVGQAFWLEAQYYTLPDRDASQAASIEWPGGRLDVTLQPTDRPLFFRAGPYYIAPPLETRPSPAPDVSTGDAPTG